MPNGSRVATNANGNGAEHRKQYAQGGRPLMYMILKGMLPTPTASDGTTGAILNEKTQIVYTGNGDTTQNKQQRGKRIVVIRTIMLTTKQHKHIGNERRHLNPEFVQWMMGFLEG